MFVFVSFLWLSTSRRRQIVDYVMDDPSQQETPGSALRVLQLLPQLAGSRYPRSLAVSGDGMPPWIGSTSPFGPPLGETGKPRRRTADAGGYAGEGVWSPKATASTMTMAIGAIHHNAARTLRRGGEACRRCSDILFAPRPVAALASREILQLYTFAHWSRRETI